MYVTLPDQQLSLIWDLELIQRCGHKTFEVKW